MKLKPEEEALIEAIRREGDISLDWRIAQRAVDAAQAVQNKVNERAAAAKIEVQKATTAVSNLASGDFYCLEHDEFGHFFKGCSTCGAGRDEERARQAGMLHGA